MSSASEARPGVLGLLGPNGAGKTTLMQIIATVTRPTAGPSSSTASTWRDPDAMRRRLGYLPQDFGVYDNLTALEFLDYLARLKGVRSRARVDEMLELVNLHAWRTAPLGGFSGGMRQRLGIAQALLGDPDLLIVDEPTAGLDPEERVRFRNVLSEISGRRLVLLSTHIVSDVESIAGEIAVMREGRLRGLGPARGAAARGRGPGLGGRRAPPRTSSGGAPSSRCRAWCARPTACTCGSSRASSPLPEAVAGRARPRGRVPLPHAVRAAAGRGGGLR